MARNSDLRVRTNLLSQVPASASKRSERLDLGEAFISDIGRGKRCVSNSLERDHDGRQTLPLRFQML